MHPTRFVYHHTRISALGAAEAVPANNSGALVWHLRSGGKDASGQHPKTEVYDALLLYSDVTFTYELAYWHTYLLAWVVFATGTITAAVPLNIPFPYESGEIYFRRTSVTAGNANIYCQPKQASISLAAASSTTITMALAGVSAAEDSPHVDGELGLKTWRVRRDVAVNSAGSDGDYCTPNTDADGYDYTHDKAYDSASNADRVFETAPPWSHSILTPVDVAPVATPIAITAAWTDLGVNIEIPTGTYKFLRVYLVIVKSDSDQIRVRALGKHTAAGAGEFAMSLAIPVVAGTPAYYDMRKEYEQWTAAELDATDYVMVEYVLNNSLPFVQLRTMCGVIGAGTATIAAAYTLGY